MRQYLATPNDFYASATARYVADVAEVGDSVEGIVVKTGLEKEDVERALSELTNLSLITTSDGKVTAKAESVTPFLRYQLDIK